MFQSELISDKNRWISLVKMKRHVANEIKHGALVLIEWEDSHHRPGWSSEAPEGKALCCQSVGWIVAQTSEAKVLTSNRTVEDQEQRCGDMTIPQRCIRRITRLD